MFLLYCVDRHIDAAVLASVKVLNFEDNCLTKWSEIRKLAILPRYSAEVLLV